MERRMRAWWIDQPGPVLRQALKYGDRPDPVPGEREVLIEVSVCGVCRTDLHLAEGDLAPSHPGIIPGHEAVGRVAALGPGCRRLTMGQRVGVPWLGSTCGLCRFCKRGSENLCTSPVFTGWDRDGGFAELMTAAEDYVYELPGVFSDEQAAPLLCAGIIGYRALLRAAVPPGGRLGIYGFGGSAHLAAQVALHQGTRVFVMTRSLAARRLALELGAGFAGGPEDVPPELLDSAILFAPSGGLVPIALRALDRGGTLAVAGIHLSDIPSLNYSSELFQERQLRSVTANTRRDGEEFLRIAAEIPIRSTITVRPMADAPQTLDDLRADRFTGAAVLQVR